MRHITMTNLYSQYLGRDLSIANRLPVYEFNSQVFKGYFTIAFGGSNKRVFVRYVTYSIRIPNPCRSSQESLTNNKPIRLIRKTNVKLSQHPEIVEERCNNSSCSSKLCRNICDLQTGMSLVIGHVTHSIKHATNYLADSDINGANRSQYAVIYQQPYYIESKYLSSQDEKTKKLQQMLENIKYEK